MSKSRRRCIHHFAKKPNIVSVNHKIGMKLVSTKRVTVSEEEVLQLLDIKIHYRNLFRKIMESGDASWKAKAYLQQLQKLIRNN